MLTEIILAILLGSIAGTITGITPGVHLNLVAIILLSLSPFLLIYTTPIILVIFIVAMAVIHTFTNTIPAIYLGAPEEGTALSVLPGHRMLIEGKGYEAVTLTIIGSLLGLVAIIILIPLFMFLIPKLYSSIKNYMAIILILTSVILILKEKKSKSWALIVYVISGILGIATLNLNLEQPLLPLLSGLFGTSGLILSLKEKTKIPAQLITKTEVKNKDLFKSIFSGVAASTICGILPGVGSAQAAIVASSVSKRWTTQTWLILVGAIDTIVTIIGFIALYTIDKTRNGSVVIISQIIGNFSKDNFIIVIATILIVAGISVIITLNLAKIFSNFITKINYSKLCLAVIILIVLIVLILTGPLGLLVLTISTFVGMIAPLRSIGRNHAMGCLILPVILFFIL